MGASDLNQKPKHNYTFGAELEFIMDDVYDPWDYDMEIDPQWSIWFWKDLLPVRIWFDSKKPSHENYVAFANLMAEEYFSDEDYSQKIEDEAKNVVGSGLIVNEIVHLVWNNIFDGEMPEELREDYDEFCREEWATLLLTMGPTDRAKREIVSPNWKVEDVTTDSSLGDRGVELILGVYDNMDQFLKDIRSAFVEINSNDAAITNEKCGLHINIGPADIKPENIDWLKFITFFNGENILKDFDRSDNHFAESRLEEYYKFIGTGEMKDPKFLFNLMIDVISRSTKYTDVNLSKLSQGYIEIRAMGGTDYQERYHEVENVIKKAVRCLDIASDKNAYRNEYLKKVYKNIKKHGYAYAAEDE